MKKISLLYFILFLIWSFRSLAAYEIRIELPKSQYVVSVSRENEGIYQQSLAKLTEDEQKSFFSTRAEFLRLSAIAFQKLRWGFGIGSVIKNKISFYRSKKEVQKGLALAETLDGDSAERLSSAVLDYQEEMLEKQKDYSALSFKEKSDEVILKLLNSLDRNLWEGAPIVSRANEFSVMAALGPQLEVGSSQGQKRGGLLDIGISLGFNRDQKAVVFQIFRDKEKFVSTQMPGIFITGLVLKAGLMVANQKSEMTSVGLSYYPPMTPGFSTTTDRSFNVGFSSGLTWPPSPLGDLLTYSNSSERRVWLRLVFSPLQKGFVGFSEGLTQDVTAVMRGLRGSSAKMTCERLFDGR